MPIIVAGKIMIKASSRDAFMERSFKSVKKARESEGCMDFSVSPDLIDSNRVNVFEKWETRQFLEDFREEGPEDDIFSLVESFYINEYEVST